MERPYVHINFAMTLDGRLANPDGSRLRISCPMDMERVHRLRQELGAVLVGAGTIIADDPLSAQVRCERTIGIGRGEWQTRVETSSVMTADAQAFHVTNLLDAYERNTRVFTKTWTFKVAREWV